MQVMLLGGFLGSGKTSFLLTIAEYISNFKQKQSETLLAIIENEIGEISIDDKMLQGEEYKVSSLFSGCICCTLSSDLTIALNSIAEKNNPQYAIIEATGLAYPDRIVDTIIKYGKNIEKVNIIVLADAERWEENYDIFENIISEQISCADIILLNKIDMVSNEVVLKIMSQIKDINPNSEIFPLSVEKGIDDSILQYILRKEEI